MRISGFTMAKNATKLYYPIREAIESILPICDEFVVALGDCDADDSTLEEIQAIGSDKIRIIHTVWDLEKFPNGMENAHQTDIAMKACTGDWLFYLQADEVVHEKDLPIIKKRCEQLVDDREIEGLLFRYLHFWGDYQHHHRSHGWYPNEIRIVRNLPDMHSFQSAQTFRRIPDFDGFSYRKKEGSLKLKVARVDATIYHYGWVRPPALMRSKRKALDSIHKGTTAMEQAYKDVPAEFDYGPLENIPRFRGTHPAVMQRQIQKFNWGKSLYASGPLRTPRAPFKHEQFKYQLITFFERLFFRNKRTFGSHNWILRKR